MYTIKFHSVVEPFINNYAMTKVSIKTELKVGLEVSMGPSKDLKENFYGLSREDLISLWRSGDPRVKIWGLSKETKIRTIDSSPQFAKCRMIVNFYSAGRIFWLTWAVCYWDKLFDLWIVKDTPTVMAEIKANLAIFKEFRCEEIF